MRLGAAFRSVAVTAFVLAAAGSATAQSNGTTGTPAATGATGGVSATGTAGATGTTGGTGQLGFQRPVQLSPQDELTQGSAIIARMDQASGTVRRQLEAARAARDVVKTLCLNDKLSQIDVATRSAKDRQTALQAAVQRNDNDLSNHEFTILTVYGQRAQQLMAEANQCIGEEVAFVGQTQVVTQVDPNLPGEDNTQYPAGDPTLISGPPVCTSCTH